MGTEIEEYPKTLYILTCTDRRMPEVPGPPSTAVNQAGTEYGVAHSTVVLVHRTPEIGERSRSRSRSRSYIKLGGKCNIYAK